MSTERHGHAASPRIVVGVDSSEHSKLALRWAARIAAYEGAQLDAIAVWNTPAAVGFYGMPPGYSPKADVEKALTATVDEVFGENRPDDMVLRVFEGMPAKVLITAGEGALMIVVGSRGHGGFAGMLLGSVSGKVAEHATCPVLVVHDDTETASK